MMSAPFPPLIANGEGWQHPPAEPVALRRRMAEVYGVGAECVEPVRGALHGVEIVLRALRSEGAQAVAIPPNPALERLLAIYALDVGDEEHDAVVASPDSRNGCLDATEALTRAGSRLLVVDESAIEFAEMDSLAPIAARTENLVVLRSLELAYGLAGAPCAALIASPRTLDRLRPFIEPAALPTPIQNAALAALAPSRAALTQSKIDGIKTERAKLASALSSATSIRSAKACVGPNVLLHVADRDAATRAIARFAVSGAWMTDEAFRLDVKPSNENALTAFGIESPRTARRGELVRETKETAIAVRVDLGAAGPIHIATGVGFFDHMLTQVAHHGGFALELSCDGDLDIDGHHTIEDCALAFGDALKRALGERRGIARYGFTLPMDEALARVSIDLGGRPYLVFTGRFASPMIGAYPTQMTEHVFRSLAQTLGAAINIAVEGDNDHHKTEACFKAFGRALRQAVAIEGESVPSTKGTIG